MSTRQSMTYGVMPSRSAFETAFERECPNGTFSVGNDKMHGNRTFTESELWTAVSEAANSWQDEGDEGAGDWASTVLDSLGFEWV